MANLSKERIFNMDTSDAGLDSIMLREEELEQGNYNISRELDFVQLKTNSIEEEIQFLKETMVQEEQQHLEEEEELKRQDMIEKNKMFNESSLNLDGSSHNLSTSYLNASTLNESAIMEASIWELEEIETLSSELRENEMEVQGIRSKIEDNMIQMQKTKNQNLLSENESKKYQHEHQILREKIKEEEEEVIMINSEMSLMPKLNQTVNNTAQDSIYTELVRKVEVTKAELGEKKQKIAHYVDLLQKIETDCKYFEGEILVLDVYDKEDETRRLQSQANLIEAYRNYHKELDKYIQTLPTVASDPSALLRSNDSAFLLRSVNQHIDLLDTRLKKLDHDLTYHRLEFATVQDNECQLGSNVKVLRAEKHKLKSEMQRLEKAREDITLGVVRRAPQAHLKPTQSTKDYTKEGKAVKSVRFETPVKEEGDENKEDATVEKTEEEVKRPMEKMEKQPQKIVIHKRRQNRQPLNIIKHY